MRIVYRGNFGVSFSTESHISATLESMGHTVIRSQENTVSWAEQMAAMEHADLFLWTCTHGYATKWSHGDAVEAVTSLNAELPTAAIHLDRFWGLKRETQVVTEPWFKLSHVFTADGDNVDRFRDAGINHHALQPGVYDAECELGTFDAKYETNLVFVGAHGFNEKTNQFSLCYHQEYRGRRELVEWLHATYGDRVTFWPKHRQHAIRGKELANLYASSEIAIGDSCFADTSTNYVSDRAFEATGRGAFSLFPRIKCVEDELVDGVHLAYFTPGDFKDLQAKIEYWLAPEQDAQRLAIREAGSAYVKEHCSYRNRLAQMLDVMGLG